MSAALAVDGVVLSSEPLLGDTERRYDNEACDPEEDHHIELDELPAARADGRFRFRDLVNRQLRSKGDDNALRMIGLTMGFLKTHDKEKNKLQKGIKKYCAADAFGRDGLNNCTSNLRMAKFNFVCLLILAATNVYFTGLNVWQFGEEMPKGRPIVQNLIFVAVCAEFLMAVGFTLRFLYNVFSLYCWSAIQQRCCSGVTCCCDGCNRCCNEWCKSVPLHQKAYNAQENIRSAGSFSLLWLLPLPPAKLFYWFTNWDIIGLDLVPALVEKGNPKNYGSCRQCCRKIRDTLKLIICVGLSLLAIPAAVQKMGYLGNALQGVEWDMHDWFHFFAVLNQMSKMWLPRQIELTGWKRYMGRLGQGKVGFMRDGSLFMDVVDQALLDALDNNKTDAMCFLSYMDIGTIGSVLNLAKLSPHGFIDEIRKFDKQRTEGSLGDTEAQSGAQSLSSIGS